MPKVSVIMSVYNGEKYLREAINSILNQTFKDFEFIIVNDGSIDSTPQILEDYKRKHFFLKIIHQENIGLMRSLNKAAKLVQGEYIARQDADDISLPERFETELAFLEEHSNAGIVGSSAYIIDDHGEILSIMQVLTENKAIQEKLLKKNCFIHGSVMFRREAFEKVGGYSDKFKHSEDYDLFLRIAERYKVYNLKDILYKYRFNLDGISFSNRKQQIKYAILARYLAQERRACRDENLEANLKKIVGNFDKDNSIVSSFLSWWHKSVLLSKHYYGIGCIHLYKGDLKKASELFFRSLKYNLFHIKAYICLFLTLLPFNLVKYLKFLFKGTAQYYRDLNGSWE